MSRTKVKALSTFFALFTVISIIYIAYAIQLPTEETQTTTLYNYTQNGTYDYIAKLQQPNLIYDNKPTLAPGEGILYTSITEHINITFTYTFEGNLNASTTIKYAISEYIVTSRWTKQITTIPQKTITNISNRTSFYVNLPKIDVKPTEDLVSRINNEIGVSTGNYNVTITTTIILNAETEAGTITEPFTATLTLASIRGAPEGNIISIDNLQTSKTGKITQTQTIHNDWAKNQQYTSYVTSAVAIGGLAFALLFYIKTKPPITQTPSEKLIEELIEPYEDIIVEATEETPKQAQTIVTMKTLEDLVKIADTLTKPVIHFRRPSTLESKEPIDTFYVLDDITRYEYRITPSMLKKVAEEHALEEHEED